MALHIPKTGLSSMMKDGAKHFAGVEEAILRNIEACKELAQVTRTSFGPNGMNKMIINHLDKLLVTNDAATILKELEVQHPAAKMMVMATQRQEEEIGDATNLVMILMGELLAQAESLIHMGLSPAEILVGFDLGLKKALETLEELACYSLEDFRDRAKVAEALRTSVASKQFGYEDFLANIIAEACVSTLPKNIANFNVDNIRVAKVLGSGVLSSQVLRGMVFKREVEGDINEVKNAKLAIFACPLDVSTTETKGTVLLKSANELLAFSKGEESLLDKEIASIAATGVNVVVSGGKIGDMVLHFLNKHKLMVVKVPSKFDVRRLCKATGATALARLGAPTKEEMGTCANVYITEIGEDRVTVFRQDEEDIAVTTIVIRGSTPNIMDDIERAVDDGVNNFKAMTKNAKFVPGAGATEIELARRLTSFADTRTGLEQYAIKKFGEAFECVPRALADNAGVDSSELISRLYASHSAGQVNSGFDITSDNASGQTGANLCDAKEAKIWDSLYTKASAIKLAAQTAVTILRVDQIIMAKPAGGPKLPKPDNRDWDDDEQGGQ